MKELLIDDRELSTPLYGPDAVQSSAKLPPGGDRFVWTAFPVTRVQKGGEGSGRYPKGSGQAYYHGTSNEIAAKILKEGLKPLSDMDRSSPVGKAFAATSEKVAISYAAMASDDTVDTITVIVFKPEATAYFKPAGKRAFGPVGSWPHAIGTEMSSTETVPPEMIQEVRTYRLADVLETIGPYKGKQYADWESEDGLPNPVSVTKKAETIYVAILCRNGVSVQKGGAGSGNRGHAGRPGHVGGSAPDQVMVGITSAGHQEGAQPHARDVEVSMHAFEKRLKALKGVRDISVTKGTGIFFGASEPTWVVSYKGNGDAYKLLAETGQKFNQDAVLIMRAGNTDVAIDLTFAKRVGHNRRAHVQRELTALDIGGGTWFKNTAGQQVLRMASVKAWGGDKEAHQIATTALATRLHALGIVTTTTATPISTEVLERDTYASVLKRSLR